MGNESEKSWTYSQITKNAEERIDDFMCKAKNSNDQDSKLMYSNWAFGVFIAWQSLTQGWMSPGDRKRLDDKTQLNKCKLESIK